MKTLKEINGEMIALNNQISREQDATKKAELEAKFEELKREAAIAKDAEQAELNEQAREAAKPKLTSKQIFRELVKMAMEHKDGIALGRETAGVSSSVLTTGATNNLTTAGAIPTTIKELLPALQNAIIYDKLGIQLPTGVANEIVWPVLSAGVTVTVNGEAATISDSTLNFAKITAVPKRVGVTTTVTHEAIDDASFDLQSVVINDFTENLAELLNTCVLRTTAVNDGLDGPFVQSGVLTKALSATPTYAELLDMKAQVAAQNIKMKAPAYVMDNQRYALLEATPKASGQGGFIIENGKIGAYPVFVSEAFADGKIGFGDFSYAALNQHGETRLVVDPYKEAASGKVRITLNARFSLTTLRANAFCLGTIGA